ncbi:MAG: vancomycin resistance protein [Burkholderiales bacterium PBB3]|nr:MAG: vancomycin resistance protein [Burkholderiales bacterium PBB3]
MLRTWLRRIVPLSARQNLAQIRRRWHDRASGNEIASVRYLPNLDGYTLQVELSQPIMRSALFENKLSNLRCGAQRLNLSTVAPNQTWSFWSHVKHPSEKNGFVVGRNLVNGQLTRQVGGGLCQLSSLLYHLSLRAGLSVAERHAHSVDIYEEQDRFTPLGADATVVWGFKDLRLRNPHPVEVVFECFVHENSLIGRAYSRQTLPTYTVDFVREQIDVQRVLVNTWVNQQPLCQTFYEQKQGMGLR